MLSVELSGSIQVAAGMISLSKVVSGELIRRVPMLEFSGSLVVQLFVIEDGLGLVGKNTMLFFAVIYFSHVYFFSQGLISPVWMVDWWMGLRRYSDSSEVFRGYLGCFSIVLHCFHGNF